MTRFCVVLLVSFLLGMPSLAGQVFPDCSNAVPICSNTPINGGTNGMGTDDFNGSSASGCLGLSSSTIESNSAWYHFRTSESGQLGFNIGFDASEDWDFALYRTDDCNNLGEPVRCNYFDNSDNNIYIGVGEDPTGADNFQYDDWLQVDAGQDFYLLINNFSTTNSGFSIQFTGNIFTDFSGTALDCSIINNLLGPPIAACENDAIVLDASTVGASTYEWYLDLGMGYNRIPAENGPTLSVAVSAMYRVVVVMSSGQNLISETQVAFSPSPITEPLIDELVCLDGTTLDLSQKDNEALGGQSPNEFRVSYYLSMIDAIGGVNALPSNFEPTMVSQTIFVRTTSIENPHCYDVSETFEINGVELPNLGFPTSVFICEDSQVVTIGQPIQEPNYTYLWDSGETSSEITVDQEGTYTLSVTNVQGTISCVSVRSVTVVFSRPPIIADVDIEYVDDDNTVTVMVREEGDFEYQVDGETPQKSNIFTDLFPGIHTVTVTDINGCGVDTEEIVILGFPKFFTPNGDNTNDSWHIPGISVLENPVISIYDKFGKLIAQLNENSSGWNGTFNGIMLPEADYWFKLSYTGSEGQTIMAKYIDNHFSLKR
ncbi:T9SS type B sorting domain-containing protein [Maribacter sp. 2304DJ31-5]|uniref:T9SS type B sorting domain-containing protein n=1 Tax=Maribacter sp. 2304DJ31-5 TaxID=3386273 RepID=UPI0039BC8352